MKDYVSLAGNGPVVLVDDDIAAAWLIRRCYERSSLANDFVWIGSRLAMIEYLRVVAAGESPIPALIILDLQMPGLDGLQTLRLIESASRSAKPAILVLADAQDSYYLARADRLGADALRMKSADPADTIEFFNSLA